MSSNKQNLSTCSLIGVFEISVIFMLSLQHLTDYLVSTNFLKHYIYIYIFFFFVNKTRVSSVNQEDPWRRK